MSKYLSNLNILISFHRKGNLGRVDQQEDYLHVDVWNYIIDETPKEKLRKISRVKDPKGLKQFVSDLTDSKSGNSHSSDANSKHKLIGSVEIPLKDIPAAGLDKWWSLEKLDAKVINEFSNVANKKYWVALFLISMKHTIQRKCKLKL